jgi:hypothetical protein
MECDYTHLNHDSLVSQNKVVTKGMIIKGFIVYALQPISLVYLISELTAYLSFVRL